MTASEDYFTTRDSSEVSVFGRLLSDVRAWLPPQLLPLLPSISFIMLKPDAYLRGDVPDILTFLAEQQVYPVKFAVRQLLAADLDNLYMFVKQKYSASWWIMEMAYGLAPSCPAIVIGDPGTFPHLSARIRELLGPTTPILGTNSQIRARFHGAHRIFNVGHGTDDPAAAVRESLVFFQPADIVQALECASRLVHGRISPNFEPPPLSELVPVKILDLDYDRAKLRVKHSLLDRCRSDLSKLRLTHAPSKSDAAPIGRLEALIERFAELLLLEQAVIDSTHTSAERRRTLLSVYGAELRTSSLLSDAIGDAMRSVSRSSGIDQSARAAVLAVISRTGRCTEIVRGLTTDVEAKEAPFEVHLAWLKELDIPLDRFDEVNLYAAWSVLATEFNDFELKFPGRL